MSYIDEFMRAVFPTAPHLAMTMFKEEHILKTATEIINDLRKENAELSKILEEKSDETDRS